MDCCNYGEYRAQGQYGGAGTGAGAGWDGYAYAPLPYAPYAHYYAPHAHDPYARYYRYDYPAHHPHHAEHVLPMDYGAYASKDTRVRRAIARRERPLVPPHLPHPPTPPLECGIAGRGPAYCEPQMWSHYQMGALGGGGWGGNSIGGSWAARNSCAREHMRYPADCRSLKGPHIPAQNQPCLQDGRSTPYRAYEEPYNGDSGARPGAPPETPAASPTVEAARARDRFFAQPKRSPAEEKRPPVVPLPAFQQAFGSTEIGKFAEAFSRAEVALEEAEAFAYDAFADWDAPPEPQWSSQPASREIKCEDNY